MSAPSLVDRLLADPLSAAVRVHRTHPSTVGAERRNPDPVHALSREHDALCRNATHPGEIAAGLETEGISDRVGRELYGVATVFELAEQMYRDVPRRTVAPTRLDPWERPKHELLTRGLVYALPGLLLVIAMQGMTRNEALLLILVSVLAAGGNQALSRLYHLIVGQSQRAAGILLRRAMACYLLAGGGLAALTVWLRAASEAGAAVTALAATYLVASTVLLLLDRHRLLILLLLPGVSVSALSVVLPEHLLPDQAALTVQVASVVAVFGSAWWSAGRAAGGVSTITPSVNDVVGSGGIVAHGCLSIILLSLIPVEALLAGRMAHGSVGPVMLPAVLSLGVAEVHLYGFRRRAGDLLAGYHLQSFSRAVRLHLLHRVGAYTILLVGLSLALHVLGQRLLGSDPHAVAHLVTYGLLCVGLFVSSLLISTGYVRTVAVIEATALVVDVVLPHLPPDLGQFSGATSHVLSAGGFAVALLIAGGVLLGRVVGYR